MPPLFIISKTYLPMDTRLSAASPILLSFYFDDGTIEGSYDIETGQDKATLYQVVTDVGARADTPMELRLWLKSAQYVAAFANAPSTFVDLSTTVCYGGESVILIEAYSLPIDVTPILREAKSLKSINVKFPLHQTFGTLLREAKKKLEYHRTLPVLDVTLSYDGIVPIIDEDLPIIEGFNEMGLKLIFKDESKRVHPSLLSPAPATPTLSATDALIQSVQMAAVKILVMHRRNATAHAERIGYRILSAVEAMAEKGSADVTALVIGNCKAIVLKALALMNFETGNNQRALQLITEAVSLMPAGAPSLNDARLLHAKILVDLGKSKQAIEIFNTIQLPPGTSDKFVSEYKTNLSQALVSPYLNVQATPNLEFAKNISDAHRLAQEALVADQSNLNALVCLTKVVGLDGQYAGSLEMALYALMRHITNKDLQANLAWSMKRFEPKSELLASIKRIVLKKATEKALEKMIVAVFVTIAEVARKDSQLDLSVALFREVELLKPTNLSAASGLASTLVHSNRPQEACEYILKVLTERSSMDETQGRLAIKDKRSGSIFTVNVRNVAQQARSLFEELPLPSYPMSDSDIKAALQQPRPDVRLVAVNESTTAIAVMGANEPAPMGQKPMCVGNLKSGNEEPLAAPQVMLLGMLSLLVKALYLIGRIDVATCVIRGIAPLKSFISGPLSESQAANEASYLWYIISLTQYCMRYQDLPQHQFEEILAGQLYCVGDSHILSLAWAPMICKGKNLVAVPLLCTGLKLWHLRKGCTLYPRETFERHIASIPSGATVIISIGEIDIREGLYSSLEKGIYKSLKEAIASLIQIYEEVLRSIASKFVSIYVMYPPPVLYEIHAITYLFWEALDQMFASPSFPTNIMPLPTAFTTTEGRIRLQERFHLDGTHLSPYCVREFTKLIK